MKAVFALVLLIAISQISAQAVVQKKWLCCKAGNNYEPRYEVSCAGSGRRLQAMVEHYCPKRLVAPKRVLQAIVHPLASNCSPYNSRRRLQAVVTYKCPVNIEGIQCFQNNTSAKCADVA